MNVQRVKVNIVPGGIIPVANLSQGDYGRAIMFEVYDGNTPADLSDVQTAFLSGEKPDGKAFTLTGTISSNCVTVTSSYQSTVLSGQIEGKLILIDSDSQLKSALLVWDVEADPSAGSVSSDEDIQDIISAALEIKDEAEQHASEAGDSALAAAASAASAAESESNAEAWAVGERGGEPVSSSDETYENNAKYYSVVCGSIQTIAGQSAEDSEAYAIGKRNGVDVGSTDPAYHNNSKYYKDQAAAIVGGGDTKDCTVTFTSSDDDTTTATTSAGMTAVSTLTSGETHASLFEKISKMFLNIRKLWNTVGTSALASGKTITGLLGNTDISGVGSTVTGAISNIAPILLWTNESPNNPFASQYVDVPGIQSYREIIVEFGRASQSYGQARYTIKTGITYIMSAIANNYIYGDYREFIIGNNQVGFADGYYGRPSGSPMSVSNDAAIPKYIYGIK